MANQKNLPTGTLANIGSRIPKSALLAGAALGLPLAAHADIVYTPLNITISTDTSTDASQDVQIGGVNEFHFTASWANGADTVTPLGSNGYVGTATNDPTPLVPVPRSDQRVYSRRERDRWHIIPGIYQKNWPKTGSAFLGIEFYIGAINPGDLHYGWINVSACVPGYGSPCNDPDPAVIQITGLGYNAVAGQSINAGQGAVPEPSALPLLALGAAGIAAFRARRKKAA